MNKTKLVKTRYGVARVITYNEKTVRLNVEGFNFSLTYSEIENIKYDINTILTDRKSNSKKYQVIEAKEIAEGKIQYLVHDLKAKGIKTRKLLESTLDKNYKVVK